MNTARFRKSVVATAVLLLSIAGCDTGVRIANPASGPDVLQARDDPHRGRVWILRESGVDLYDARTHEKLRSIALPEWTWVNKFDASLPDLAVGPKGEVLVSSNVVPVVWHIDGTSFQVSRHELQLAEENGREVGFSTLKYLPQHAAYTAVNGLDGSLWRIDASLRHAEQVLISNSSSKGG